MYDDDSNTCDDKVLLSEIGINTDIITLEFRVLLTKLLVHYCWKLRKNDRQHSDFVAMIEHSREMTNLVNGFISNVNKSVVEKWTLDKIGAICDKIEKMVDLTNQDCISKVADIMAPKIVFEKGDYER